MKWLLEQIEAAGVIIGGGLMIFVGLMIGDLFGSIGDKLFGSKKKEPNDESH